MIANLKTAALVTSIFAVIFGIFTQICLWCADYNVSPWLSIPGTLGIYGGIYWKLFRATSGGIG